MRPILVVDDDQGIREFLRLVLEMDDYVVQTVNDGVAALELLTHTDEVWIVLLDISMPRMTGLEVCARLSAMQGPAARHLVVLMTAGRFPDGDVPPPVRALLPKPFDLAAFQALIAGLATADPVTDDESPASGAASSVTGMVEPERWVA